MKLPEKAPEITKIIAMLGTDMLSEALSRRSGAEVNRQYLHWDELRRRPAPDGLTHDAWWLSIAYSRNSTARALPLVDGSGTPFFVTTPDSVLELVHTIDRDASGRIELPELISTPAVRDRYVVNSLIEESITSSQLEGASTTRRVAKEMLRSGRPPRSPDEKMILNNFRAMEWVRERRDQPITTESVLELHRLVTADTLDGGSDGAGRFRRSDEPITVVDNTDDEVLHQPPPAESLASRMDSMCRFAAGDFQDGFIHPVVRSVLLHFWVGFDHPFVDGNGRTARALFYWSMLKQGYWLAEFLSISRLLKKAPTQYARAYLYAEAGNDATHFVLHQLRIIRQAIDDLAAYLKRKTKEVRETEHAIKQADDLNHRQLALVGHALRNIDAEYTIEGHRRSHNVVYETARKDLLELVERGWFTQKQHGRTFIYRPVAELDRRLAGKPGKKR